MALQIFFQELHIELDSRPSMWLQPSLKRFALLDLLSPCVAAHPNAFVCPLPHRPSNRSLLTERHVITMQTLVRLMRCLGSICRICLAECGSADQSLYPYLYPYV